MGTSLKIQNRESLAGSPKYIAIFKNNPQVTLTASLFGSNKRREQIDWVEITRNRTQENMSIADGQRNMIIGAQLGGFLGALLAMPSVSEAVTWDMDVSIHLTNGEVVKVVIKNLHDAQCIYPHIEEGIRRLEAGETREVKEAQNRLDAAIARRKAAEQKLQDFYNEQEKKKKEYLSKQEAQKREAGVETPVCNSNDKANVNLRNIVNQSVFSNTYGEGVITEQGKDSITVAFSTGDRIYAFPDGFGKSLIAKDPEIAAAISTLLQEKQAVSKRKADESERKRQETLMAEKRSQNARAELLEMFKAGGIDIADEVYAEENMQRELNWDTDTSDPY